MRRCCICGAKIMHPNPSEKIDTCSPECRAAKDHGRTLAEQLALEADSIPWSGSPTSNAHPATRYRDDRASGALI